MLQYFSELEAYVEDNTLLNARPALAPTCVSLTGHMVLDVFSSVVFLKPSMPIHSHLVRKVCNGIFCGS